MRLITIPISHYCERARWALEHVGLAYREEPHLQFLHWPHARLAGGGKTVPVLVTDDGDVLTDSAEIVRWCDQRAVPARRLYPDHPALRREIEALERDHAGTLGVESRRLMYFHFFDMGKDVLEINGGRAPSWERWLFTTLYPALRPLARRYLGVRPETARAAREVVDRAFDTIGERLADGRRYLVGDRFTAADLTFACMAVAVTSSDVYGTPLPTLDQLPPEPREMMTSYRAHPAGAFALRMFRDHRPPPPAM